MNLAQRWTAEIKRLLASSRACSKPGCGRRVVWRAGHNPLRHLAGVCYVCWGEHRRDSARPSRQSRRQWRRVARASWCSNCATTVPWAAHWIALGHCRVRQEEFEVAQQALAANQRRLSDQRGLPVANSAKAFSVERRKLDTARRRGDRSAMCNFTGHDRPKLCVGNGPRECWCARVRPEIADRLVTAFGAEKALAVLIEDPPKPMQALANIIGHAAKTAHADLFRRSKFCTAGCTSDDTACAACRGDVQRLRDRSTADTQRRLWQSP